MTTPETVTGSPAAPAPVLKARQLGKQVTSPEGPLRILDAVGMDVRPGESVAIVGTSGAGKSTLLGFVFQSFHLIASLTALENVMLPLELAGAPNPAEAALEAIRTVGLEPRKGHYPHQLSGGEKQRVAIARAFVVEPAVLFADEPTGNLDQRTGERIVELLFRLNREHGTTLVLVTHDLELARRCDRILFMEAGRIEREEAAGAA
jgi:putative ABC transport system ATP-binding protein